MIKIEAAGFTDIGKVRKANEDSLLIDQSTGIFVVADGMGGHRGGAVASRLAVQTMGDYLTATNGKASGTSSPTDAEQAAAEETRRLLQSIALANKKIYSRSLNDESCRGMGTTISALFLQGDFIIAANVGDSPIYLIRRGKLKDLYTPHTLLHERKAIQQSMADRFPPGKMAHILTRAVGIRQRVRIDHVTTHIFPDDIIILCSDGLSGKVSRKEIGRVALCNEPEAACKKLTELALQRGGQDNITVIILKIISTSDAPSKGFLHRVFSIPSWIGSFLKGKRFNQTNEN
jgi:serine/threonine protein phosphatase PrpC